jgi:hypothetical protein
MIWFGEQGRLLTRARTLGWSGQNFASQEKPQAADGRFLLHPANFAHYHN